MFSSKNIVFLPDTVPNKVILATKLLLKQKLLFELELLKLAEDLLLFLQKLLILQKCEKATLIHLCFNLLIGSNFH